MADETPKQGMFGNDVDEKSKKRSKFPYREFAFLLVDPPHRVVSTHQIRNRTEHCKLLNKAQAKKYYIYHTSVKKVGKKFFAKGKWIIDWESVDNIHGTPESMDNDSSESMNAGLSCPFCGKKMKSTPGRTLHVKGKHPESYEEYQRTKNG